MGTLKAAPTKLNGGYGNIRGAATTRIQKAGAPSNFQPIKPATGEAPKKPKPENTPVPAPKGYKAAPGETFFSGDGRPPGGSKSTWVGSTVRDGYFKNEGALNKARDWEAKQPGANKVTIPWKNVEGGKSHLGPSGKNAKVAGNGPKKPSGIPNMPSKTNKTK